VHWTFCGDFGERNLSVSFCYGSIGIGVNGRMMHSYPLAFGFPLDDAIADGSISFVPTSLDLLEDGS
jgi:hypothetical protein